MSLAQLAAAFANMQTTRDLDLISSLTTAVPPSVAEFYANTYATGTGPNGTLVITDLLGAAIGVPFTSDITNVTTTINSMTSDGILNTLIVIYTRMQNTVDGVYNTGAGSTVVIPAGPGAGTYANPDEALNALITVAAAEVAGIESLYPTQSSVLNSNFISMAANLNTENINLRLASIDVANLDPTSRGPIMSLVQSLPDYGVNTEQDGPAQFLETIANLSTQGGQAIVACLREGKNIFVLDAAGAGQDTVIPGTPDSIPPRANLIPSTYTEAESANLVVK
jgi:hypothetical protein